MNKKINIILIISIIFIVCFLSILSFYKFYIIRNEDNNENNIKYGVYDVGMKIVYSYDINYAEEYKDNILTDVITEVEYSIFDEDDILYGKVFIGSNNKLYIYDELHNKNYLILDKDIKTLYDASKGFNFCSVYAITKTGELYHIGLIQPSISNVIVRRNNIQDKVINFTNITLNTYSNRYSNSVVVLTSDGTMYDTLTLTEYNPNTINVMDRYIVYDTGFISDLNKNLLIDSKGENYRVGVIAASNKPIDALENNPYIIIVTLDNKLIYLSDDVKTYEYPKKVKAVGINDDNMIVVVFDDDKYIEFSGFYDSKHFPVLPEESENNLE